MKPLFISGLLAFLSFILLIYFKLEHLAGTQIIVLITIICVAVFVVVAFYTLLKLQKK